MKPEIARYHSELHDAFFADRDQELMDFLRMEAADIEQQELERMQAHLGIHDPNVLNELKRLGVNSSSMTAFSLLPLLRLAWADSKIQQGEFACILKAAENDGIEFGTPAYRLLTKWIEARPTDKMLNAWRNYAHAVTKEMDEKSLAALRLSIMERIRRVAEAAGGTLGFGDKISENERRILQDISSMLTKSLN